MTENLPATRPDEGQELHADHRDPQHQEVQQNVGVALVPLAIIALILLAFIAAAWTFLAAQPLA